MKKPGPLLALSALVLVAGCHARAATMDEGGGHLPDRMSVVHTKDLPWYTASDHALARQIASPTAGGAQAMSVAEIVVHPGVHIRRHHHAWEEIYYILEGQGTMHVGSATQTVRAGDSVVIHPEDWHDIVNDTRADIRLVVMCAPPFSNDGLKFE